MRPTPLKVAVLVSAGCHPVSGAPRAAPGDAVALTLAKDLAGRALRVVHAGLPDDPALQDYLAEGATEIEVVPATPGADVASLLAQRLADADLVLTGSRSERGAGSGLLPYLLAHILDRPVLPNVLAVKPAGEELQVRQFLPKGRRRAVVVAPRAVLVVHPLAPVRPTYAYARRATGRIVVSDAIVSDASSLPASPTDWTHVPDKRQLVRLRAEDKKSAHARLAAAITSPSKGGAVVIEGTDVDKAQVVLDYMKEHRLIEL